MPHEGSQIDGGAVARRNLWKMAVHCHAGTRVDSQPAGLAVTSPSAVMTTSTGFLQFGHSLCRDLSGV
jgi:hypothetical protein